MKTEDYQRLFEAQFELALEAHAAGGFSALRGGIASRTRRVNDGWLACAMQPSSHAQLAPQGREAECCLAAWEQAYEFLAA